MSVIGWKLDPAERPRLLKQFPPEWPDVIADHITLKSGADCREPLPSDNRACIVGETSDGQGLQAMVVAIGGETARPGGGTYHITWSLDRSCGRDPVESNDLIAQKGWRPVDPPVPLRILPSRF